nr:immunoglobulin light chain junction region [Macaca mulatta]MOX73473.1 immunoglobulin light chain junction region [Macaca mulatta]MOX73757.1 immunoglobulin light chain junction region [Macaca mulatta]MOX74600.1 immunoglobulin light chain junction region [Macaca mulatta]MOX75256.1 immunoglobulin light chain junction region [Macaca mulatta]
DYYCYSADSSGNHWVF